MKETLLSVFQNPNDLLALEPEELGGVILELVPGVMQNGIFSRASFLAQWFNGTGTSYPNPIRRSVELAIEEAFSWLISQVLIMHDPAQASGWYVLTRRAKTLRSRADVTAFRKGRMLPVNLLQPTLAEKVWPQFLRGDHIIAVFQAFKEVMPRS